VVAGWGSVNEDTQGPPIWDVVASYIGAQGEVAPLASGHVRVVGG
jgi:sulfur-oxidizing protein SoxB